MPVKSVIYWTTMIQGYAKVVSHNMLIYGECKLDETTLLSVLSACTQLGLAFNGKCKEALTLFDEMCVERIQPDDVIFIAVLSTCTHGGLVGEGKRVFSQMVKQFNIVPQIYIEKVPGCSSIQVENKVHEFLVMDTKHQNMMEIFEILNFLYVS
ncbi:hypothetical protein MKX01_041031 [Papaver californicum]|nr:hypothetical protein MKX01_041031 [Papaver californicum]